MVISLLETVIITNVLHHNSMKYRDVPRWVQVVVLTYIARLICYRWPEEDSPHAREKPDAAAPHATQPPAQPTTMTTPQTPRNSEIDFSSVTNKSRSLESVQSLEQCRATDLVQGLLSHG